jgi:ubiquinone/menaquinone biosynthesis C-methylase UbiE
MHLLVDRIAFNKCEERISVEFKRYDHPNLVLRRYHLKRFRLVLDLLMRVQKSQNQTETVLLDVGCGDGRYEAALEKNFSYLIALDVTRQNLRNAEQAIDEEDRVDFVLADVEHLPFIDMSADVVLCSEVLEHVNDPSEALSELSRVFRQALIVTVPILNIFRRVRFIPYGPKLRRIESDIGHVNMHEWSWWKSVASEAVKKRGDRCEAKTVHIYVSSEPFTSWFTSLNSYAAYAFFNKILGVLENFLSRPAFANHLIVVLTAHQ